MKTLNVVILCAGKGSRFTEVGYDLPKPLIPVLGKPMIQWVLDSIEFTKYNINVQYIFLVLKEHCDKFNIDKEILKLLPNRMCWVIQVDKVTEGAAATALLAKDIINKDEPLLICNSDQFIKFNKEKFLLQINCGKKMIYSHIDGIIFTFTSDGDLKWSYSKVKNNGIVEEIAEKRLLDDKNDATVGIYFYKKGSDFVKYAEQMISKNIRTNQEFYLCPCYNEFIQDGKIITIFPVDEMWGLGLPSDKLYFEQNYKG